eukprot:Gb_14604 [translate_table: standard]
MQQRILLQTTGSRSEFCGEFRLIFFMLSICWVCIDIFFITESKNSSDPFAQVSSSTWRASFRFVLLPSIAQIMFFNVRPHGGNRRDYTSGEMGSWVSQEMVQN